MKLKIIIISLLVILLLFVFFFENIRFEYFKYRFKNYPSKDMLGLNKRSSLNFLYGLTYEDVVKIVGHEPDALSDIFYFLDIEYDISCKLLIAYLKHSLENGGWDSIFLSHQKQLIAKNKQENIFAEKSQTYYWIYYNNKNQRFFFMADFNEIDDIYILSWFLITPQYSDTIEIPGSFDDSALFKNSLK